MPLFKTTYFSNQLLEDVDINIYIPEAFSTNYQHLDVVLLFHGMCGSENAWIRMGNIIRTADECQVIVIMPRLNNNFGLDMESGYNAEKYIIEEVYELSHKWFNLPREKEKNIIAGLSMGGFIALNLGIKYQNLFSHIIALSAPTNATYLKNKFPANDTIKRIIQNAIGTNEEKLKKYSIVNQVKEKEISSKIDLYCGSNDEFYNDLIKTYEILKDKKVNVTLLEDDGNHTWHYWEKYLKEFLTRRNK